jgi:hypothetical protein
MATDRWKLGVRAREFIHVLWEMGLGHGRDTIPKEYLV